MQIVNDVARRGFVIGWDPLKLGNALSCVATLFALSQRTGVATLFPYAERYGDIFPSQPALSMVHVPRGLNRERLVPLLERLETTLETLPHLAGIEGSSFADLGEARTSGVVWFSRQEGYLSDWREGNAERHLRTFCRRGNGLVLQGSYWRQYTDMRPMAKVGDALRRHLGPLRTDYLAGWDDGSAPRDTVKIGVHLRLGDYRIWWNGKYYFGIDAYRAVVERLRRELGARPHVFHAFSDQSLDEGSFGDVPVRLAPADQFADFVRLSTCDYVVGPPSTFSTWAAFLGRSRRLVLTKERIDGTEALLPQAIAIPFPTGSYLPGDERGGPI